ncbi:hypothetical protein AURDEDRAFT_46072, partial [Auricularia subglabra TFB-10046 SS5]
MLDFAVAYRAAIDKITSDREAELRTLELSDKEWETMQQLRDVLKVLKDATLFFSRKTPNLAMVIPAMDHIDQVFSDQSVDHKFNAAIRASLGLAKKTLNRYYSVTDYSDLYRIAMVLHPQYKLEYFRHMKWPEDWIATAVTITRDEYTRTYAK